jgi:hypothetical protein
MLHLVRKIHVRSILSSLAYFMVLADTWIVRRGLIADPNYIENSTDVFSFPVQASLQLQYTTSMYYSFTILTTVGFGDIHAVTVPDMIASSLVMICGGKKYLIVFF